MDPSKFDARDAKRLGGIASTNILTVDYINIVQFIRALSNTFTKHENK